MSALSELQSLPPLSDQEWSNLPDSDPASPYYLPPAGTYQNDAGQIVPISTPNSPSGSAPSASSSSNSGNSFAALIQKVKDAWNNDGTNSAGGFGLTDIVFIILGLLLITAGIFAFKSTQTVIEVAGRAGKKVGEIAGAVSD